MAGKPVELVVYACPTATRSSRRSAENSVTATIGFRHPASPGKPGFGPGNRRPGPCGGLPPSRAEELARLAKQHGDQAIPALIAAVAGLFSGRPVSVTLSGHSGGGSFIFGYLNTVATIPDRMTRIAFLNANYAYDKSLGHGRNWPPGYKPPIGISLHPGLRRRGGPFRREAVRLRDRRRLGQEP